MDLLQDLLTDRGRWTQAVFAEARSSMPFLPDLGRLFDESILGDPIEIQDAEQVERIRVARLGGRPTEPLKHLGEAETCFLIKNDPSFAEAIWVTDDGDAFDFGKQIGITTWDTNICMQMHVANGDIVARVAFDLMQDMLDYGRSLRSVPSAVQDLL